ncbi:MAG: DegT/DnrJ/EryC1/StrS aminotransferase family protein [Acidobacteria bacterium]|nr:DegT/DnrJ/EryC1/StrS aminotransferase family protein [Acidobacteriota bacterium]
MSRFIPTHRPAIGDQELAAVACVFDSRWLGAGAATAAFEDALRAQLGVPHVVAVSSGTAALHLALEALALPPGSGVLVPSLTFVASVQAIVAARLRPVFCDVVADTLQVDLEDCATRLRAAGRDGIGVRAVMPVHFGGTSCDITQLVTLATDNGLRIVEDAAHAFGSNRSGRALGTIGDAGCYSFDPIKTITCGEGGAIVTASDALAARLRPARTLGISADGWRRHTGAAAWAYTVESHGWRAHMPDINAAIGLTQLSRLPDFRARRQAIVSRYDSALARVRGLTPVTRPHPDACPFTYTVRVHDGRRDDLMAWLRARDIGTSVEYIPNHLQPAFAAFRTPLPATEQVFTDILSLPLYSDLVDEDVDLVVSAIHEFFDGDRVP